MSIITIKGYKIRVNARTGSQLAAYRRLYSTYSNNRLIELHYETIRDSIESFTASRNKAPS